MANKEVLFTLRDAVAEVLGTLTGLELEYDPNLDRFQAATRALNRALRAVALEKEWSVYAATEELGLATTGMTEIDMNSSLRPRIVNDDCVRLVDDNGNVQRWAYFLPRDALHKYRYRNDLHVAVTRTTLSFSRPLSLAENGLHIMVPTMREPKMFELPTDGAEVPERILSQPVDFDYPDLVIAKAAELMAGSDPVMQPRVQSLQATYKDLMYQLIARDDAITDTPYENDFIMPMDGTLAGPSNPMAHGHPHADIRTR